MRRNEKDFLDRKTTVELDNHKLNYDKTVAVLARITKIYKIIFQYIIQLFNIHFTPIKWITYTTYF